MCYSIARKGVVYMNFIQEKNETNVTKNRHFIHMIDSMKVEDLVPARYGTWSPEPDEEMPDLMFKHVVCSACKGKANTTYKFCPCCGAKMN